MSEVRHHIIHRQTIEVEIPKARSVTAVQERIRDTWYSSILPGLDTIFSSLVDPGTVVRIDKIQVDLGRLNEPQLEQQLTTRVLDSVRKALEEQLRFEPGASDGVSAFPVAKSDWETLLYFLANGRLPWWSTVKDLEVLETSIMKRGRLPEGASARLLEAIGDEPVLRRLCAQFSGNFLRFVAAAWWAPPPGRAGHASDDTDPAEVLASIVRGERFRLPEAAAASPGSPDGSPFSGEGPKAAKDDLSPEEPAPTAAPPTTSDDATLAMTNDDLPPVSGHTPPGTNVSSDKQEVLPAPGDPARTATGITSGLGLREETRSAASPSHSQTDRMHPVDGITRGAGLPKKEKGDRVISPHRQSLRDNDEEAIYMELAGLVLVHPFILPFFEALGLTEGRSFRDDTSLHKAVHLLGYLATGDVDLQEQRLILPKLLCGMPLTDPVERSGILTAEEEAEADQLLTTVASHWKVMKKASTAALRELFLQREGRLSTLDNGWLLTVEKKTVDILMGSLPWGLAVVKYPWMSTLLFVSWG